MDNISFTKQVKEELCSNEYTSIDRLRALLAAYIRISGSIHISNKKSNLTLVSTNAKISRFIYETINKIYDCNAHLTFEKTSKLNKNTKYIINLDDASNMILEDLEISFLEGKISKNIVKNDDTISGYLIGAFLASGSINSPKTSNYHLEISLNSENYAKWLSHLFGRYKNSDVEPKISKRRNNYILYFKKSDQISNFLIMIGAVSSCMEFENIRIDRDFMNVTNRLTNLDTANMRKTCDTANRQIEEIKSIDSKLGLNNITNKKVRELCYLRLENEQASMNELKDLLNEKLNINITKSNINHLFRAIHDLYKRLNP